MLSVQHIVCSLLFFTVFSVHGQEDCKTPSNKQGRCVPLQQCPYMDNAFKLGKIDENAKLYLRNSLCRYEKRVPIVCCENDAGACVTPSNKPGACMQMKRCDAIMRFLEKKPFLDDRKVMYMRNSKCTFGSTDVSRYCCPVFQKNIS